MSTILKALRRLEADKRAEATRSLDEAVLDTAAPVRSARGLGARAAAGIMVAIGVIAIVGSLSGFWLEAPEGTPASTPAAPANTVDTVETIEQAAPEPELPVVQREGALPGTLAEALARVKRPPIMKPVPQMPSPAAAPIEILGNPEETRHEMQRLAARPIVRVDEPEPVTGSSAEPALAPVVEMPTPARPPAVVARVPGPTPAPRPRVAGVPRERMPGIAVQEIIWHPNPIRRIAVFEVDGAKPERHGEGDEIAGFTIAEIGLSDVVLVRDGVPLRRRIGANWP